MIDLNVLTPKAVMDWLNASIAVGSFKFAPLDVVIAVVAFIVIQRIASLLKMLLEKRVFPRTHLDSGVKDSILTFTGYAGMLIALMVALSILGIQLSSIALIAGALSVGIGFGLQNIVNNFVSGIILLVERPIKVGDWVSVGGHEGIVTHIRVRATEIETFQHASVIIPNADLLQNPVINWLHLNRSGRVEIGIDLDYTTDIKKAEEVLLATVEGQPGILSNPAPQVLFMDYGASGLRFELRFHIEDVTRRMATASDTRKKIFHALQANDIHIPFQVVDVRLQGIEELLKGKSAS